MTSFSGVFTALVTPFLSNGELDLAGFKKNLTFQAERGADGVVVLGTTGEAPTVSYAERKLLIETAVKELKGIIPVIIGTGSNATATTIDMTKEAKELGADAAIVITPYYNKPTQEGLYQHYKILTQTVDLPIILYNCPGRTGVNLQPATMAKLAELKYVQSIKEASGNITQISEVIETLGKNSKKIAVLSGDDALTLPTLSIGGTGVISVLSNLDPMPIKEMINAFNRGDLELAKAKHHLMAPAIRALFCETNPIPIKAAMQLYGMSSGPCRLPLVNASRTCLQTLETALQGFCNFSLAT